MEASGYCALVAGATGLVGRHLVGNLLHDPACGRVIVVARGEMPAALARASKLQWLRIDYERLEDGLADAKADIVYCALGTTMAKAGSRQAFRRVDYDYSLALAEWAERTGVRGFVLVTSMGAASESLFYYSRVKGELEEAVANTSIPQIVVFRPSVLLGDRAESRRVERIVTALARSLRFAFIGPLRRYRAVKAAEVADAMRVAGSRTARGMTVGLLPGIRREAVRTVPTAAGGTMIVVESDAIPAIAREILE